MPTFPKTEVEVVALAQSMVNGYTTYPADFPSIDPLTQLADLQGALTAYNSDKQAQDDASSQAKQATATKVTKLDDLVELMKNDLKLSEVDCAADPVKLSEIGWGTKSAPQPAQAPGQPLDLHPVAEGPGNIWLSWDKPLSGGSVRTYIVQRREQPAGGEFGDWLIAGTSLNNEVNLLDQQRGVQFEYRVIAENTAGQSTPSNTAAAVL
ncbi:MAG: fibronectin type III domain-containing protein [Phycisphaerae bacterium]|nr:fibronectin type III domain-containing protein [Phycisphaerae bacterium]